ncbi:MAG: glycosyltransferase [bacterium]
MEKIRVHILGMRGIPSTYSGYETFVGELAPRLADRGHDVTVYCRRSLFAERPETWKGVKLVYLPSIEHKIFSTLSHSLLAMKRATAARPDIILAVNAATGWFAWIPRLSGVPLIVNVDGMEWLRPKWSTLGRLMFLNGARLACRTAAALVTDAEEMRRLYKEKFGVDSVCIAYGAGVQRSANPEAVRKYGLTPGKYFMQAGRLVPDNNADLVVAAFGLLRGDYELAIVGGAGYRGNAAERSFKDRLQKTADKRVRFTGHIDNGEDFRELCCNCLGYIHAHEFGGTNPSLLNALGCGAMVLALDTRFNREVLNDGEYGVLFSKTAESLHQAMRRNCDFPDDVLGFKGKAKRRIQERYTWEQITDQYETLFDAVRRHLPPHDGCV